MPALIELPKFLFICCTLIRQNTVGHPQNRTFCLDESLELIDWVPVPLSTFMLNKQISDLFLTSQEYWGWGRILVGQFSLWSHKTFCFLEAQGYTPKRLIRVDLCPDYLKVFRKTCAKKFLTLLAGFEVFPTLIQAAPASYVSLKSEK